MFLGYVDKGCEDLVVALFFSFLENTTSSTDLDRELLTASVSDKLARLLLHILGRARGLVHRPALFGTLTIAHFLCGSVTLSHCLIESLLLEGDLTGLLKVLLTDLLLTGFELGNICVVALLCVLVCALQDWLLLQTCHRLLLLDTAEPSLPVLLTVAEVDPPCRCGVLLPSVAEDASSPRAGLLSPREGPSCRLGNWPALKGVPDYLG